MTLNRSNVFTDCPKTVFYKDSFVTIILMKGIWEGKHGAAWSYYKKNGGGCSCLLSLPYMCFDTESEALKYFRKTLKESLDRDSLEFPAYKRSYALALKTVVQPELF